MRGWNTFAVSYISTGNFDELKRARLLCHAQSQRAAVIHQTSYVQDALAYQVQVPIMQTCENVNQNSTTISWSPRSSFARTPTIIPTVW